MRFLLDVDTNKEESEICLRTFSPEPYAQRLSQKAEREFWAHSFLPAFAFRKEFRGAVNILVSRITGIHGALSHNDMIYLAHC
jgi:hypothetical protein